MKVQIAILQNYPWNTIKSRSLQCINVDCDLFINLGAAGVLQSLRLNLEEKAGKEISEPSRSTTNNWPKAMFAKYLESD